MKKALTILLVLTASLALGLSAAGCSDEPSPPTGPAGSATATSSTAGSATATSETATTETGGADSESAEDDGETIVAYPDALTLAYDENDLDATWDASTASFITLADASIRFDGAGGDRDGRRQQGHHHRRRHVRRQRRPQRRPDRGGRSERRTSCAWS